MSPERQAPEETGDLRARLLAEVKQRLKFLPHLEEAEALGICGSLARGDFGPRSDVDVFVVVPDGSPPKMDDAWDLRLRRVLRGLGRDVSVFVYGRGNIKGVCHWHVLGLAADATLVHDRAGVADLFRQVLEEACAAGLVRRRCGRHPVWMMGRPLAPGEIIKVEVKD